MTHWTERARCIGSPLAWWFPASKHDETPALKICARCPVRQECLDDALATGETTRGIRGGLTPEQRRALAKRKTGHARTCYRCHYPLPAGSHRSRRYHPGCQAEARRERNRISSSRRYEKRKQNPPIYTIPCATCRTDVVTKDRRTRFCEPCRKQARLDAATRWRTNQRATCPWCKRLAPLGKPMHDRCAAEQKTATHLHQKMQETA